MQLPKENEQTTSYINKHITKDLAIRTPLKTEDGLLFRRIIVGSIWTGEAVSCNGDVYTSRVDKCSGSLLFDSTNLL